MDGILEKSAVKRVQQALLHNGITGQIKVLEDSARSAAEAAAALGIKVGQIASSIIFKLSDQSPLLVITSGRHRVDTDLVARQLGEDQLGRVDADYVKEASGFSIGGVAPIGWINQPKIVIIDQALNDYEVVWAAAGHPHAVFPTTYDELLKCTSARPLVVKKKKKVVTGQVSVLVIPATACTFAKTVRPRSSMLADSARMITSYGPVTPSAIVTPAMAETAFATLEALPTSV